VRLGSASRPSSCSGLDEWVETQELHELLGFPDVTFIVATHSPLVVTATPDAFVYALAPDGEGRVHSRRVENINSSATPDEILMSMWGLDTALPLWAESRVS
jgi:hypothetical protein